MKSNSTTAIYVDESTPAFHCAHDDGKVSIRLGAIAAQTSVYLVGTIEELDEWLKRMSVAISQACVHEDDAWKAQVLAGTPPWPGGAS